MTTSTTTTSTTIKTSHLATNFNNKLAGDYMCHIEMAPQFRLRESTMKSTIYEIRTKDNSFPPSMWQLVFIITMPLKDITDKFTFISHGMEWFDFVKWFMAEKTVTDNNTPIAVYYYKKYLVE